MKLTRSLIGALVCASLVLTSTAQAEVKVRQTFYPDETGLVEVEVSLTRSQINQLVDLFYAIGQVEGSDLGPNMENFLVSGAQMDPYQVWPGIRRLTTGLTGVPPTGVGQDYYVRQVTTFVQGDLTVVVADLLFENLVRSSNESGITTDFLSNDDGGFSVTVDPEDPLLDYLPQSPDMGVFAVEDGSPGSDIITTVNNLLAESRQIAAPFTYTLVLPGEVVESNATRTAGREAIWKYTLENLEERENVAWSATSGPAVEDLASTKAAFTTDLQNAISAYNASQPETEATAGMADAQDDQPKQFDPRSLAAQAANAGYDLMRRKSFNEAIQQYEIARQEDPKYEWIYQVAVWCAENQSRGMDFISSQAPRPELTGISLGDYFGWTKQENNQMPFAATHNPAAYQQYQQQQRQGNPAMAPIQPRYRR